MFACANPDCDVVVGSMTRWLNRNVVYDNPNPKGNKGCVLVLSYQR